MPLAAVTHLSVALEKNVPDSEFGFESFERFFFHHAEDFTEGADGIVIKQTDEGLRRIDSGIGEQHADCREITRLRWNDHGWNRQLMRQRAGMERSAAAITEEHEFARIEAMLHGDAPDRSSHDHGRDGDHAVCHPDHAVAPNVTQRLGDPFLDGALSRVHVEFHFTAEKVIGVEPPEN